MSASAREEAKQATQTLTDIDSEMSRRVGWDAHWHPVGSAQREHSPSLSDIKEATKSRNICFVMDEYEAIVYHGVKSPDELVEIQAFVEALPRIGQRMPLDSRTADAKLSMFEQHGLIVRRVLWTDETAMRTICAFMNGGISREDLEKSLAS